MGAPNSWTYKITELGKVAGAFTTIAAFLVLFWGLTFGPLGELYSQFQRTVAAAEEMQIKQADLQAQQQDILSSLSGIVQDQTALLTRVEALENTRVENAQPAIRFARKGHWISSGKVGDTITVVWRLYKLRDCGRPQVDLVFRSSTNQIHRFDDVSIVNPDGMGIIFETAPEREQEISYNARIPDDEGVEAGRAWGWVSISYPINCPGLAPVTSPEVNFMINVTPGVPE